MSNEKAITSELRQDPLSGDWVVVAGGRAKRPDTFRVGAKKKNSSAACAFCSFFAKENLQPNGGIIVVPNKYPAFSPDNKIVKLSRGLTSAGLFRKKPAIGFHEVVLLKNHKQQLADLSSDEIRDLINVYQERYLALCNKKSVNYVFIFHNQGPSAGASIVHPHSQIIASSVADYGFLQPLKCAQKFYQQKKQCVYCQIVRSEIKSKERIVLQNKSFIALCPFASKVAFETMILPKNHSPYFEKITEAEKYDLAEILKNVLIKIKKGLNNSDYNFYITTSPCDNNSHPYFHWHLTILPKTAVYAGFELGAGMEIITTSPEQAAEYLRKIYPV